jgi:poly(3-hydroxybutyrate) depolymerase
MSPRGFLLALAVSLIATVALAQARDRRTPVDTGYTAATLSVNGVERRYLVRRPAGDRPPTAIMLLLHGGGGHVEPSRSQGYAHFVARVLGRQSAELEMAEEVWRFFATH